MKGKCSNIVLDQCKKTGLVFDSVMVGVEMVSTEAADVVEALTTKAAIERGGAAGR